jgi:hypothetical protein
MAGTKVAEKAGAKERPEEPQLLVNDFTVAIHIAAMDRQPDLPRRQERIAAQYVSSDSRSSDHNSDRQLRSYERDMLSYAYRDAPHFYTTVLNKAPRHGAGRLTIGFPARTAYQSENKNWLSVPADESKSCAVAFQAAITDFVDSPISILHIVLRSCPKLHASTQPKRYGLDEYDLIKLIKLWEGGEGQPVPGSLDEQARKNEVPHFFVGSDQVLSVDDLFNKIFQDHGAFELCKHRIDPGAHGQNSNAPDDTVNTGQRLETRVGSVVVSLPPIIDAVVFEELKSIRENPTTFDKKWRSCSPDDERWLQLVAAGGLIQGLLDFDRINSDELVDVYAGFAKKDQCLFKEAVSVIGFHKGTLLQINAAEEETSDEGQSVIDSRESPIELDPYLLVPHAVLLFNDELLKETLKSSEKVVQDGTWWMRLWRPSLRIKNTQELLNNQRKFLGDLNLNVFNYLNEQTLFDAGQKARGLQDRTRDLQARLDVDSHQLDMRIKRRDTYTGMASVGFTVIGALGITAKHADLGLTVGLGAVLVFIVVSIVIRLVP